MKKLLLSGSHAGTTAFSIVEEIRKRDLDWKIYFLGKKWATEEKKSYSLEYKELPKIGVTFIPIESGKIQTKFTKDTIFAFLKIPYGFIHTYLIILKLKPDLTLSFGGAAGALSCLCSWILHIPTIIHEQTTSAGRANISTSKFAKVVAISRETSRKYFNNKNIVLTGDPISKNIINLIGSNLKRTVKTIFVTGGSRGSVVINNAIKPILPKLLEKYVVIHQVGEEHLDEFRSIKNKNYYLHGQISIKRWPEILNKADIVIGRAGSNTVSELVALRKPSILIPIPWSYLDEQNQNAKYMSDLGLAAIIKQDELSSDILLREVDKIIEKYDSIIDKCSNIVSPDIFASEKLVDILEKYI